MTNGFFLATFGYFQNCKSSDPWIETPSAFPSEQLMTSLMLSDCWSFHPIQLPLSLDNSCPYLTRERTIKTQKDKTLEDLTFFGDLLVTNVSSTSNKGPMCFFISSTCMVYLKDSLVCMPLITGLLPWAMIQSELFQGQIPPKWWIQSIIVWLNQCRVIFLETISLEFFSPLLTDFFLMSFTLLCFTAHALPPPGNLCWLFQPIEKRHT